MDRTLILLPGLLCDATIWRAQAEALGGVFDVRAQGFLDHDSLEAMARAVLAEAPERFALAGHSMGGRVALEILTLAPERVEQVALLDTGAHPPRPTETASRGLLVDLAFAEGMEAVARTWLPPMLHPARTTDTALMETLSAMVRRATPELFRKQQNALLNRPDGFPRLRSIRVPCALIVGREDSWSPPAQHEDMQAALPHATLTVIEDCGHMSPVEQPEAVTRALKTWMEVPAWA